MLNVIKNVLVWVFIALAVFMTAFTIISVTTFDRNDRTLFGFRAYIVKTDSMSKTDFDAGDLIFVKDIDRSTLKAGDIITYISQNSDSFGETITHKIRERVTDAEGKPGFITYGTTTDTNDETIVTYPFVMGKYVGKVANMGHFFNFLKTTQGYIICIFVPFMLLIIYQAINFFTLFRRYKAEQMAVLQAERDEIEAQRAENAKMLEELQALKAQLAGDKCDTEAAPSQDTAE